MWPRVSTWNNIGGLIFRQDSAPPNFALTVRTRRDQHFPGRWLGRRGSYEWPPRSPDPTQYDLSVGLHQGGGVQDETLCTGGLGDKN